jgi:hypothetical protein
MKTMTRKQLAPPEQHYRQRHVAVLGSHRFIPSLTLTQPGTLGIGTATPNLNYKLDVQGGTISTSGGLVDRW